MRIYYTPVRDRLMVKRIDENDKTAAGLLIVGGLEDLVRGQVVAVGAGSPYNNTGWADFPIPVNVGDVVYYPPKVGVDVKLAGETFRILQYDQAFLTVSSQEADQGQSLPGEVEEMLVAPHVAVPWDEDLASDAE